MDKNTNAVIEGKNIDLARTIGSMYDNNSISVWIGEEYYRIQAPELLKLIQKGKFNVEAKKKYNYLVVK